MQKNPLKTNAIVANQVADAVKRVGYSLHLQQG
jgi:hypothetical protein